FRPEGQCPVPQAASSGSMIDRANRLSLMIFGLVVAVAGAAGLAARAGSLDEPGASYVRVRDGVADRPVLLLAILVIALLIARLGGRVVLAELGMRQASSPDPYVITGPRGATRIAPRAIEHALEAELRRHPSIRGTRARVISVGQDTAVALSLTVARGVDLEQASSETRAACDRLCDALGARSVAGELEVDLVSPAQARGW
ncbi:MAG: hypothetical protein ACRDV9_07780, partial [Acidimicrobiia bacterium]